MLKGTAVTLVQKSIWKRNYDLAEGERTFGTLSFPSLLSDEAVARIGEENWTLRSKGVFDPVATVHHDKDKRPIASMSLRPTRGTYKLKLPHYRSLRLTVNIWKSEYALKTTMNATLCTLKVGKGPKFSGDFVVEEDSEYLEKYPWLVFFAGYVALLNQRRRGS